MDIFIRPVCCLLMVVFMSCGGTPSPRRNGSMDSSVHILRLNMQSEPLSLDPREAGYDRRSGVVLGMLFEGLTRVTPDQEIVPAMAEDIEISDDKCTYTFRLREALWSNGEPVTAHDFESTWKAILEPGSGAPAAYAFYIIRGGEAVKRGDLPVEQLGLQALDAHTLLVELEHPAPYFLYMLSSPVFAPVCSQASSDTQVPSINNGPFRLTDWQHGREIMVKKNPYYWDSHAVRMDGIKLTMVEDSHTVLELFEKGQLDWVGEPLSELPVSALDGLRESSQLKTCPVGGIFQLKLNVEKPPLQSTKLRQALAYAIDRQSLIDHVLKGGERVAHSVLPRALTLGAGSTIDGDPERARCLLDEALGELDCTLEELPAITLSYATIEGHKALAQAIQQQWHQALGISVSLEGHDWNTFFAMMGRGEVQIGGAAWFSRIRDPIDNLKHVKSRSLRYNSTRWEDPHYRALLDAADMELDELRRAEFLREAEELVMRELPLVPLYEATYKYLVRDEVQGVFVSDLGQVDFKWACFNEQT